MAKLAAAEVSALDPYQLMATSGTRVIHMAKAVPSLGYVLVTSERLG